VTWELNFHTQERELAGILQVLERSSLKEWRILTYNQEEERKENWYIIHVLPVWKWIINHL
jgi:hypothetical protein